MVTSTTAARPWCRDDKLNLEQLTAYAFTDDHAKWESVFEMLDDYSEREDNQWNWDDPGRARAVSEDRSFGVRTNALQESMIASPIEVNLL